MQLSDDDLLAEEKSGRDFPAQRSIDTAEIPSEDIAERDKYIERLATKYEDVFKTREDAEYFAMLPLSDADRDRVLSRARYLTSREAV
jgi:hypothetical protein